MNTATATVTAETVTDEQIGELLVTGIITHGTYLCALGRGFAAPDQPAWRSYLDAARGRCAAAINARAPLSGPPRWRAILTVRRRPLVGGSGVNPEHSTPPPEGTSFWCAVYELAWAVR